MIAHSLIKTISHVEVTWENLAENQFVLSVIFSYFYIIILLKIFTLDVFLIFNS